jgi:hypothetical protein
MTTLNGLVGIDFNLSAIVVCTLLSSEWAVLIHQFHDYQPHQCRSSNQLSSHPNPQQSMTLPTCS